MIHEAGQEEDGKRRQVMRLGGRLKNELSQEGGGMMRHLMRRSGET